jgi:hypothetical protein
MPDYKNGKVYKIVCNITGKVYVGSTTQTLSMRLTGHRKEYKRFKEGKRNNVSSFDIIQQGNYDIVLIENVSCESKEELHRRERHSIETLVCVNKIIPTRTQKEYLEAHKEEHREHMKAYYELHKKGIKEHQKVFYDENKEKINERHKAYYESHKEEINEKKKAKRKASKVKNKE